MFLVGSGRDSSVLNFNVAISHSFPPIWSPLHHKECLPFFPPKAVGCPLQHASPITPLCNCQRWIPICSKLPKSQCPNFSLWTCSGEDPGLPPSSQNFPLNSRARNWDCQSILSKSARYTSTLSTEKQNKDSHLKENCIESYCPSLEKEMLHLPLLLDPTESTLDYWIKHTII